MLASSYGHNEVVEILVSNGANISLQDNVRSIILFIFLSAFCPHLLLF